MAAPDHAARVAEALAATRRPTGKRSKLERALEAMPADERAAWEAVLGDLTLPAQWVHRAILHAGIDAGATESCVLTWRRNHTSG